MSNETNLESEQILAAIERLSAELNAASASKRSFDGILISARELSGSSSARLFRVRLPSQSISLEATTKPCVDSPILDFRKVAKSSDSTDLKGFSILEQVVAKRKACMVCDSEIASVAPWADPKAEQLLAFPVLRGDSCVGVLELEWECVTHLSKLTFALLAHTASIIRLFFDRFDAFSILEATRYQIDISLPFKNFVESLVERAVLALDMPYLALRKWDGHDTLECLAQHGFGNLKPVDLDLVHIENYPSFVGALTQDKVVIVHLRPEEGLRQPELASVGSFMVAPIRVGEGRAFGTVSCAAEGPYDFSEMEESGLESIANWIGESILNYRNATTRADAIADDARLSVGLTALEVAQAARHEARSALMHASMYATQIFNECQKEVKQVNRGRILDVIESMMTTHQDLDRSLDRIKQITKPPAPELEEVSIKELWRQAFGLLTGRLDELRVSYSIDGPDVSLNVNADYVRHAFVNLIVNSIDAFRELRRRRDRSIRVSISPYSESSPKLRMHYVDNATGIDLARLGSTGRGEIHSPNDVFRAGVTTKPDGCGFGLYLVRQILIDHDGSIELTDSKNGVTFEITISAKLKPHSSIE